MKAAVMARPVVPGKVERMAVTGRTIVVQCLFDRANLTVPADLFDQSGRIAKKYVGKTFEGGVHITDVGHYCNVNCFANYCAD